jgi:GTPase
MPRPVVAIVGRPNVGKSSLFNSLAGRRISIVDPTAGVTRDRIATIIEAGSRYFELVDTGGMGIEDMDNLTADVEHQITVALEKADLILFMVDGKEGILPLDQAIAERLRTITKPILLVANKCDNPSLEMQAGDFHRFGFEPLIKVSAEQKRNQDILIEEILKKLPPSTEDENPDQVQLLMAIVGKRNVGKSTFINSLAAEDRVIVSEVAGTTRDSVDVRIQKDGKTYVIIDTAGVRNKSSFATSIEFYSMHRAEKSIRRADVVLLFFDALVPIGRLDKQLADYVLKHHKPAIFVVNKWDLAIESTDTESYSKYIRNTFPMLDYIPIAFVTAKEGKNVFRLFNLAQELVKQAKQRIGTGELNRVLEHAISEQPPPTRMNRFPKVFFATQAAVEPPTIVLFVNDPELFDEPYRRFLMKHFRNALPFGEVPINLEVRSRHDRRKKNSEPVENPMGKPVFDMVIPVEQKRPEIMEPQVVKPPKKKKPRDERSELWDI